MEKKKLMSHSKRKREKFDTKKKFGEKVKVWQTETNEINNLKASYSKIDSSKIENLSDFPLSEKTLKGLKHAKFTTPTKIQQQSIGLALGGNDVLGAAKTGSGKTLAFLIPVLECLYCNKWSPRDGLGALIISPTRELAYQIFEVLRKIGKFHDFSAGLVIGGKHVREEAERINNTNIVICTPGRLLQHMDETAYFHADNLQMLVLDEADRILDLGFQKTMNAIVENLPKKRQTLLFSATQTKSVRDLARLSLKDPMYVSVHENAQHSTPTQLEQSYMVCPLEDKVSLVWSFVKHHLKAKTLIFMASCKQVRFIHEVFRRLRPGVPVLALHGAMQQMKRMSTYEAFCRKQNAVLFATDIAARGLDFPAVHWVLQLDCPEDANTYIHRAGRTARYEKNGEALLILLPTEEEAMVTQLTARKIPINKIKVNPKKQRPIQGKMEAMVAGEVQLKEFAQRAFVSYLKSVFYMSNKAVFDVTKVDLDALSRSYGLALTPRVRFIEREKAKREALEKRKARALETLQKQNEKKAKKESSSSSDDDDDDSSEESGSSDAESGSSEESSSDEESDEDSSSEEGEAKQPSSREDVDGGFGSFEDDVTLGDIFKIKKKSTDVDLEAEVEQQASDEAAKNKKSKTLTKFAAAKKVLKKNLQVNTKIEFTEDGEEVVDVHRKRKSKTAADHDDDDEAYTGGINIEQAKLRLKEEDKIDKALYRDKIKQKHKDEKRKEKERRKLEKQERRGAVREDGQEAVLSTRSDSGSDSEVSDSALDFLPDPDKLYGRQTSEDREEDDGWDSAEYDSDGEMESPRKKRLRLAEDEEEEEEDESDDDDDDESDDDDDDDDDMDTGVSLADDEMMALKLLQGT